MKEKIISVMKAIGYFLLTIVIQFVIAILTMVFIISNKVNLLINTSTQGFAIDIFISQYMKKISLIMAIYSIVNILFIMLIYRLKNRKVNEEFGLKIINCKNIILSIGIGIACWLINSVVLTFMMKANILTKSFESFAEASNLLTNENIFINILVVGIIVPLAEEFVFRGAIFRTLKKSMSIKYAIILQAILFGIAHGNLVQFIYTVFIGGILGYVVYSSKSLWPAIAIHMTNNIIATVASEPVDLVLQNNIIAVVILIVAIITLIFSLKVVNKYNIEINKVQVMID